MCISFYVTLREFILFASALVYMYVYVIIPVIWCATISYGLFTNFYCNQDGYTAMISAAREGHKDIVEYLVGQGADKDTKDNVSTYLVDAH